MTLLEIKAPIAVDVRCRSTKSSATMNSGDSDASGAIDLAELSAFVAGGFKKAGLAGVPPRELAAVRPDLRQWPLGEALHQSGVRGRGQGPFRVSRHHSNLWCRRRRRHRSPLGNGRSFCRC